MNRNRKSYSIQIHLDAFLHVCKAYLHDSTSAPWALCALQCSTISMYFYRLCIMHAIVKKKTAAPMMLTRELAIYGIIDDV